MTPEIRISDADRERAAVRLQTALGEGRITVDELEERLAVVYASRYASDLSPVFADLPGGVAAVAGLAGAGPAPAVPGGDPASVSTPSGPPLVLRTGMGTLRRVGPWRVPPRLRVQSVMGSVQLSFVEAQLAGPVTEIELQLGAGSARLVLPDGATADVDGLVSGMGSVRSRVPSRPRPDRPHFRVYGRTGMGSVVVRPQYRFGGFVF